MKNWKEKDFFQAVAVYIYMMDSLLVFFLFRFHFFIYLGIFLPSFSRHSRSNNDQRSGGEKKGNIRDAHFFLSHSFDINLF